MPLTKTHKLYDLALRDRDLYPVIAYGSAGTGKTYGACAAAIEWWEKSKSHNVIMTRPNVSFAKSVAALPGTPREKMAPWIRPIEQNFTALGVGARALENIEKNGRLTYIPLEFIQGLTFDNTLMVVDECQNMTFEQLKVFLTRQGNYSKTVLCGDVAQTSPLFRNSGLQELLNMIDALGIDCHTIHFTQEDIVRSAQCAKWIRGFEQWEKMRG